MLFFYFSPLFLPWICPFRCGLHADYDPASCFPLAVGYFSYYYISANFSCRMRFVSVHCPYSTYNPSQIRKYLFSWVICNALASITYCQASISSYNSVDSPDMYQCAYLWFYIGRCRHWTMSWCKQGNKLASSLETIFCNPFPSLSSPTLYPYSFLHALFLLLRFIPTPSFSVQLWRRVALVNRLKIITVVCYLFKTVLSVHTQHIQKTWADSSE